MDLERTLQENFAHHGAQGMLEPLVEQIGLRWVDFTLNPTGKYGSETILSILEKRGLIIRPQGDFERIRPLTAKLCEDLSLKSAEIDYLNSCYRQLVEVVEEAGNKVLIIPKEFVIIPDNYETSIRFRKWGDLIRLRRYKSRKKANEAKVTPRKLCKEAFERVRLYEFYTGYNFEGIREGEGDIFNRVLLEDCIDSVIIFVYCDSEERKEKAAKIELIQPGFGNPVTGGIFTVRMPSVDKKHVPYYEVLLKSVPIKQEGSFDYSTWFNLNSPHYCRIRQESANTSRFKRGMHDLCKHIGAANLFLGKFLKHSSDPYELAVLTNMVPTERQFTYSMNLRNRTLVEFQEDGGVRRRGLIKMEREVMQWKRVALMGFEKTFDGKKGFEMYVLSS